MFLARELTPGGENTRVFVILLGHVVKLEREKISPLFQKFMTK
jgi:hypothetical protein